METLPETLATAAVAEAARAVFAAESNPSLRGDALLAIERAIELSIRLVESSSKSILDDIASRCLQPTWTVHLRGRIALLQHEITSGRTPLRRVVECANVPFEDRLVEVAYDIQRLLVTKPTSPSDPSISWTTAWMRHPAFDRVTPMARAFQDDRDFENHVLQLAHEVTHVISLRGAIGFTVNILRMALLHAEMALWRSRYSEIDEKFSDAFVDAQGIAHTEPGSITQLSIVEIAASTALKLNLFQEVWRPLLEGLAVFGEGCADPADDRAIIDDVALCIRNLFDVDVEAGDPETARSAHLSFVGEFDTMLSKAIRKQGPAHLEGFLIDGDKCYFCGYMVIRAIVSRLRATTARPISGAQAFRLLLHAFKYGAFEFIPDIDQSPDAFFQDAIEKMQDFLRSIARLTEESISQFLHHDDPTTSPGYFRWKNGKLIPVDATPTDGDAFTKEFEPWTEWSFAKSLMPRLLTDYGPPGSWDLAKNGRSLRQCLAWAQRASAKEMLTSEQTQGDIRDVFRHRETWATRPAAAT